MIIKGVFILIIQKPEKLHITYALYCLAISNRGVFAMIPK